MTKYQEEIDARYHDENYESPLMDLKNQRVAVYCRTAVPFPTQVSSMELLKKPYEDFIAEHEGWTLAKMYVDEGVPGSHAEDIPNLQRMLADARSGMFDLIITKDISRFARNIVDVIGITRELSALNPPIGVYFRNEDYYTLDKKSEDEMILSLAGCAADEESRWKAEHMISGHDPRLRRSSDHECDLQFRT